MILFDTFKPYVYIRRCQADCCVSEQKSIALLIERAGHCPEVGRVGLARVPISPKIFQFV